MSQTATKDDLKIIGDGLRGEIKTLGNTLRDEIQENTRDIISHFNKSQGTQNEWIKARFDKVDERFDKVDANIEELAEDVSKIKLAVIDLLATDKHLHNLVTALKGQGLKLNDAEIFRS